MARGYIVAMTIGGENMFSIKRLRPWALLLFCIVFAGSFVIFQQPAWAKNITLAWDPNTEPDLAGYRIYYRSGSSGAQNLANYTGSGAAEGVSPILVPVQADENPDAGIVQFTLHELEEAATYCFVVTAYTTGGAEGGCSREVFVLGSEDVFDPYNEGWGISAGDLKGFTVLYNSLMDPGVTPTLGPSEDIPSLNLPNLQAVGTPLNLQPSGAVFRQPVWIEFPCPGYSDMNQLSLALYDEEIWVVAWDGSTGNHTTAGVGLLEGEPEYNAYEEPQTIAIVVKHFTGVQAALTGQSLSRSASIGGQGGGGGGCFISTLLGN